MVVKASYRLLGGEIDAVTIRDLHGMIDMAIRTRERLVIVSQNLHSIYLLRRDATMRELHAIARCKRIDGMPLILLGRLLGYPLRREHRVTWVDWIRPLMAEAARRSWRVFYVGSKPGVAERGATILRSEIPGLQLVTQHGYFEASSDSEECKRVLHRIDTYRPQLLIVGMGMPKQEHWILGNLGSLNSDVILTSGACMDYVAGVVPTPPRWMGRFGFEWAYRLAGNPRRFWRRYVLEPWCVPGLFLHDLWTIRIRPRRAAARLGIGNNELH